MNDQRKTKKQLIDELELRGRKDAYRDPAEQSVDSLITGGVRVSR